MQKAKQPCIMSHMPLTITLKKRVILIVKTFGLKTTYYLTIKSITYVSDQTSHLVRPE